MQDAQRCLSLSRAVRSPVMRICCVSLAIFGLAIIGSAGADEFPIKKLSSFTWVVDYESFWSPDSRQIARLEPACRNEGACDECGQREPRQ